MIQQLITSATGTDALHHDKLVIPVHIMSIQPIISSTRSTFPFVPGLVKILVEILYNWHVV